MRSLDDAFRTQLDQKENTFQQRMARLIKEKDHEIGVAQQRVWLETVLCICTYSITVCTSYDVFCAIFIPIGVMLIVLVMCI